MIHGSVQRAIPALPLLTAVLAAWRPHLNLADDLLIYLVAVVTITVLGGFWPAVLAAVAASLLPAIIRLAWREPEQFAILFRALRGP